MKRTHELRYLSGEQVEAGDLKMGRLPVKDEGHADVIGRVDGAVIDATERRIKFLVVNMRTGKKLMPLGAARLNRTESCLQLVCSGDADEWERFDSSAFEEYDEEALMTLMFGSPAA